jgi:hypothetical protein
LDALLKRNACVFNHRSQSTVELAAQVLEQVELWISARYHSLLPLGFVVFVFLPVPRHQSSDDSVICNVLLLPLNETCAKARSRKK